MADHPIPRTRFERAVTSVQRIATTAWARLRHALRNPVRLLVFGIFTALIVLAVPLLVGGAARLGRVWDDWRHARTVTSEWVPATATVRAVRVVDGLDLDLSYFDRRGDRYETELNVDAPGSDWIHSRLPIRYDPSHPESVDLVGVAETHPIGSALVAGAALGAGTAALILAFAVWRRRLVLVASPRPMAVMRTPLALSGAVLTIGIAAWGVGTVTTQGWASIANRIGVQASDLFGDFLVFLVPAFTFAAGALASAWLARHRHHERHDGVLSSAHRLIDRAAEYMPSPEQIRVERPDPDVDGEEVRVPDPPDPGSGASDSGESPHAA
jgi:hypothetical protein